jgi:hypothetical protein
MFFKFLIKAAFFIQRIPTINCSEKVFVKIQITSVVLQLEQWCLVLLLLAGPNRVSAISPGTPLEHFEASNLDSLVASLFRYPETYR